MDMNLVILILVMVTLSYAPSAWRGVRGRILWRYHCLRMVRLANRLTELAPYRHRTDWYARHLRWSHTPPAQVIFPLLIWGTCSLGLFACMPVIVSFVSTFIALVIGGILAVFTAPWALRRRVR